ncbi:hypothetical protein MKX01_018564 [Papaver californicum]|nr:hypothetical protein MKX01_018564 [Papaver californicum]
MAKKLLILMLCFATMIPAAQPMPPKDIDRQMNAECAPRCTKRCSLTAFKKPCTFFCNKCCNKCLCVPPGTYGNKEMCPCYNNWKTKRGGPKCP